MHRLRPVSKATAVRSLGVVVASFLFSFLGGCGGHSSSGASPFPGKIFLTPATSASLQLGETLNFTASAQNNTGSVLNPAFTYTSSDTSILNLAPNGVACAGVWDAAFVSCTPQNYGVVQVTASALGATSLPTVVYVHPPVDNITISAICPANGIPPACPGPQKIPNACIPNPPAARFPSCVPGQNPVLQPPPCLSANQSITFQANAFSNGIDVTTSVGPFTWSETNLSVVGVTPLVTDTNTNIPTNQATVTASAPGFTAVYATASNVASQPYYAETCPVQCVALELGSVGSGQTTFDISKSTTAAETVFATAVDVQGCVVPKPTLTWSSSHPGSVLAGAASSGCPAGSSCAVTTQSPGSGSITAACVPPTCNIGFPQSVTGLPQTILQPVPVYPVTAVSGLVSGAPTSTTVMATSLGCANHLFCSANLYNVSTSTNVSGNPVSFPAPPDSLLFDPAGDKIYVGGNYGSLIITPANFGGATNPFSGLSNVTGQVLATSANGNYAIFANNAQSPNQVYVVNATNASSPSVTILNISGATAAAFSPDGLKAFIVGPASASCTLSAAPACLYVWSPVQSLQTYPLTAVATAITFSSTGSFAFLTGGSATSTVSVYNTCDNSSNPLSITLPAAPLFLNVVPPATPPPPVANAGLASSCTPSIPGTPPTLCENLDILVGLDNTGLDIIATNATRTSSATPCPQAIAIASNPVTLVPFQPVHINLGQGTFNPLNFFLSPDANTAYIVTSDRSDILVYDFATNSTSGSIPLANNSVTGQPVAPVMASMTVDGTLIYVADNYGELHEVSTTLGTDLMQITFPNLPDVTNPFCSSGSSAVACNLNFVGVKP